MWLADLFRSSPGKRFFDLLDAHASVLLEAARTLAAYVDSGKADDYPLLNGSPIGSQATRLSDNDVIQLAGVKMGFFLN